MSQESKVQESTREYIASEKIRNLLKLARKCSELIEEARRVPTTFDLTAPLESAHDTYLDEIKYHLMVNNFTAYVDVDWDAVRADFGG